MVCIALVVECCMCVEKKLCFHLFIIACAAEIPIPNSLCYPKPLLPFEEKLVGVLVVES